MSENEGREGGRLRERKGQGERQRETKLLKYIHAFYTKIIQYNTVLF